MPKHPSPRARLSKRPIPDNLDTSIRIGRLYRELVEIEALSITADEAVTMLPVRPSGKYARTTARLYSLVGAISGRASAALEQGEELLAQHEAASERRRADTRRRTRKAG